MATSETVSSVSNSNKQNTNQESVSYLVAYKNPLGYIEDNAAFAVFDDVENVYDLYKRIYNAFDTTDTDQFVVLEFYNAGLKTFKQTLELV